MLCANCNRDKPKGKLYGFYYGKIESVRHIARNSTDDAFVKGKTLTKYNFGGSRTAWICNGCLKSRLLLSSFGLTFMLGIWSIFSLVFTSGDIRAIWFILLISFILLIGKYIFVDGLMNSINKYGDKIAIHIFKKELKQSGWDMFFTRMDRIKYGLSELEVWKPVAPTVDEEKTVIVEKGLCWFCEKQPCEDEINVKINLKRDDEKTILEIPRCQKCFDEDNRSDKESKIVTAVLLISLAAFFIIWQFVGSWLYGLFTAIILVIAVFIWFLRDVFISTKKSDRKELIEIDQRHPELAKHLQQGWMRL
jgi:hypothetical protein